MLTGMLSFHAFPQDRKMRTHKNAPSLLASLSKFMTDLMTGFRFSASYVSGKVTVFSLRHIDQMVV